MFGENLNRTREGMKRRIAWLNKKHCKTAKELADTLKEQAELGRGLMRIDVCAALLECFKILVNKTPHDTGRARNSWTISNTGTSYIPEKRIYPEYQGEEVANAAAQALREVKGAIYESDVIWIYSNVEYMLALNADWSRKYAGNFIDLFLQELKRELNKAASASRL